MALDKNMLSRYLEDGIPAFRVYRWASPSFTYGFSQDPQKAVDMFRCASDNIEVARRITGGGILFHDDEITYSLVCGKEDIGEPRGVFVSYRETCSFLISFYRSLGLHASFAFESPDFKKRSPAHEFCSASHEKFDIVVNGRKIGGNAQKRTRRAIFQHGSVPRSINWPFISRYVISLPQDVSAGVTALSAELNTVPDKGILEEKLIESFARVFGVRLVEQKQSAYEARMA